MKNLQKDRDSGLSQKSSLNEIPLTAHLKAEIEAHPTNTFIRSTEIKWEDIVVKNLISRPEVTLPKNFNGKEVWKDFLSPVKNQGNCGACWGFASSSTLADRFNILSQGAMKLNLSAAKIILCDQGGKEFVIKHREENLLNTRKFLNQQVEELTKTACYGSSLVDAWRYLFLMGTTTNKCIPYNKNYGTFSVKKSLGNFTSPQQIPICPAISGLFGDMCSDYMYDQFTAEETGTPARFYRCRHFYALAGTSMDNGNEYIIRHDIFLYGPVSTAIKIYGDFYTFNPKTEIYKWDQKSPLISGHAIEIVGWGEDDGIPYWIIKNSWGSTWGIDGYFKMIRGQNDCDIEDNVITGLPDFFLNPKEDLSLYHLYNTWADQQFQPQRNSIDRDLTVTAGGINPQTGYTRRIMTTMPWLDFTPPIATKDLPDFTKFIAGKIKPYQHNKSEAGSTKNGTKQKRYHRQDSLIFWIFIIIISMFIMTLIIFIILYIFKTFRK